MTTKKVRIVGDKWPPPSNTYAQIDCSQVLCEIIPGLAKDLSTEQAVLEKDYVFCRAVEGGKMGPPIAMTDVLDMVAAKPILFLKKKAAPAAKPGVKGAVPVKKIPPPPPGAKTSSPKAASNAPPAPAAKSPMKKMIAKTKTAVPPGPAGAKKVSPKPAAKPAAAPTTSAAPPTPTASESEGPKKEDSETPQNDNDDFDAAAAASKIAGAVMGGASPNNGGGGDSDTDNGTSRSESLQNNSQAMGGSTATNNNNGPTPAESRSSSATPTPSAAAVTKSTPPPPPPTTATATAGGGKKTFAKKSTPPPEVEAAPPQQQQTSASSGSGASGSAILATSGNSAGMDNVAAALAAQRSVDERLLQLRKSLVDEEKKRIEQYEVNLRHALAAEVDSIKSQLNSSMQEERTRSMQVQAVLEEQRTQLLKALAERDSQLQLAQGALQEAVQLGGKQAGPALAAISGGASSGTGSSSNSELAKEMQSQNDQLKKLLASKDSDAKASKNANRAELDAMIKAQSQLVRSIDQLHNSTSNGQAAPAIEEQKKDLASFLASVGLSRFTEILTKQDIDFEILSSMSDEELAKAGVDTVGARKRILLEFVKTKKNQQAQLQLQQQFGPGASRELFAQNGAAAAGSPLSPTNGAKKSVTFGQNTSVPPPPPPAALYAGSPSMSGASSPTLGHRQQAQQDAQQASIQASQLPPVLQDHHRVLHQLFRRAGAADWLSRSAEMVDSFKDSLPALYEAVSSKLGVPAANYQPGTGATALKQFISRRFPHLIPAIDVMVFLADGREAEFADTMMLRQLKIGPQRLVWFCVPVHPSKAPEFAEDTSDGKEKLYFYSSLSKMSQWKRPTLFPDDKPVPKVVLPQKLLDDGIPNNGDKLSPNPKASTIGVHRATDQQFIAATLSLLMRKDPSRLSQFPEFCRAYERRIEGADGKTEGKINYKGMYLDALQSYGPDDD